MSAYLVFTLRKLHDRAGLAEYWSRIGTTLADSGARNLSAYRPVETLEGESVPGVVITEFPSVEAAKAWYNGPDYGAIRHLRQSAADYDGYLVDGGVTPVSERLPDLGSSTEEPSVR